MHALLTCSTRREAARAAGIDEKTLRKYLNQPEFSQAYSEALQELLSNTIAEAKQSLSPALSVLREIAENKEELTSNRISAARGLLEYSTRLINSNTGASATIERACDPLSAALYELQRQGEIDKWLVSDSIL